MFYKLGLVVCLVSLYGLNAKASKDAKGCEPGLEAFKNSVHQHIRNDCIQCHQDGPGPKFAVEDPERSYARVLPYVRFHDIKNSKFVTKGGNQHCLNYNGNCTSKFEDIERILTQWWEDGQKECPPAGNYFTKTTALKDLPDPSEGFQVLSWKLNTIDPELEKAHFQIEAMRFLDGNGKTNSYLLRKPRVVTEEKTIYVENVKTLLNGKYDEQFGAFTFVKGTVSPRPIPAELPSTFPVLSSYQLLIPQESETDELSIAFDEIRPAEAKLECQHMDLFEKHVKRLIDVRNCYACHGGGPDQAPGRFPANAALPMKLDDQTLCNEMLERANGKVPADAPLIAYPLRGTFHPIVIPHPGEVFPGFLEWMSAEFGS